MQAREFLLELFVFPELELDFGLSSLRCTEALMRPFAAGRLVANRVAPIKTLYEIPERQCHRFAPIPRFHRSRKSVSCRYDDAGSGLYERGSIPYCVSAAVSSGDLPMSANSVPRLRCSSAHPLF